MCNGVSGSLPLEGKQLFPGSTAEPDPEPLSHQGYEWFCVLSGRLRLILGDQDVVLGAGEIAEFDTHVPHWMGSADGSPVEILNLFGPQGERTHTTARTFAAPDSDTPTPPGEHWPDDPGFWSRSLIARLLGG